MAIAPSFTDLVNLGIAEAADRRPDLAFGDDDVSTALVHAAAAGGDLVLRHAVQLFAETFYDSAKREALDRLVADRTGLTRHPATAATVTLTFTRTSAGAAGTVPLGTEVKTAPDALGRTLTFTTNADAAFLLGSNGPVAVTATATTLGSDGNVAAGTATVLGPTFDATITVTNAAGAGGNAAETDDALVMRARLYPTTLSLGTLAALERVALSVPSVRVAIADEDLVSGVVTLQVSDFDGNSTLQMVHDVFNAIQTVRCGGCVVNVVGAQRAALDLSITLRVRRGYSVAENAAGFVAAAATLINKQRVGEVLYLDRLVAALINVAPDFVLDVTFTAITLGGTAQNPSADVTPASNVVMRAGALAFSEAA